MKELFVTWKQLSQIRQLELQAEATGVWSDKIWGEGLSRILDMPVQQLMEQYGYQDTKVVAY